MHGDRVALLAQVQQVAQQRHLVQQSLHLLRLVVESAAHVPLQRRLFQGHVDELGVVFVRLHRTACRTRAQLAHTRRDQMAQTRLHLRHVPWQLHVDLDQLRRGQLRLDVGREARHEHDAAHGQPADEPLQLAEAAGSCKIRSGWMPLCLPTNHICRVAERLDKAAAVGLRLSVQPQNERLLIREQQSMRATHDDAGDVPRFDRLFQQIADEDARRDESYAASEVLLSSETQCEFTG